jgi:potassium-transporting ATPase KdpC subunit
MRQQLFPALKILAVFTVLVGVLYPLSITAIAQVAFRDRANGSLVERDGVIVGSELQAQAFDDDRYFHPRPSAADHDGSATGGSNLGPTNRELLEEVADRVESYRLRNGLAATTAVPVDAVTSSASGLDPHVSVANARLQADRVARARRMPPGDVLALIDEHTSGRAAGSLGEPIVNVLRLNLALDATADQPGTG